MATDPSPRDVDDDAGPTPPSPRHRRFRPFGSIRESFNAAGEAARETLAAIPPKRLIALIGVVGPILVGLLGVLVALWVSVNPLGIFGQVAEVGQAAAEHEETMRGHRDDAYQQFLNGATALRLQTNAVAAKCPALAKAAPRIACDESALWIAADQFQVAHARLRAVASPDGRQAAQELASALPGPTYRFADGTLHSVDPGVYAISYQRVLDAMCADLRDADSAC